VCVVVACISCPHHYLTTEKCLGIEEEGMMSRIAKEEDGMRGARAGRQAE
jgi:hypothetical protein